MSAITKVVIPVAGLGTRFLPVTKAQPKEMLPVVDKPVIQYVVEEAVASGITDVILVTGSNKRAIEDHFDSNQDLENFLRSNGKEEAAEAIKQISAMANFIYIRQKGPYGNGTPVMNAAHLLGNEPFAVMWGDDIFYGSTPRLKQLVEAYNQYGDPVITAVSVKSEQTRKYGIIDGIEVEPTIYKVNQVVEKPEPEQAPSTIASIGGYILTPDILPILESTGVGKNNELWLTDAMNSLMQKRPFYAKMVDATYYDTGSIAGWLKANAALASDNAEYKSAIQDGLST